MKELRKELQIIFQDPYESLNPRMTVSQAIQAPLIIQKIYKLSLIHISVPGRKILE